MLTFSGRYT